MPSPAGEGIENAGSSRPGAGKKVPLRREGDRYKNNLEGMPPRRKGAGVFFFFDGQRGEQEIGDFLFRDYGDRLKRMVT